jgi:hypothetical protein
VICISKDWKTYTKQVFLYSKSIIRFGSQSVCPFVCRILEIRVKSFQVLMTLILFTEANTFYVEVDAIIFRSQSLFYLYNDFRLRRPLFFSSPFWSWSLRVRTVVCAQYLLRGRRCALKARGREAVIELENLPCSTLLLVVAHLCCNTSKNRHYVSVTVACSLFNAIPD